MNVVRNVIFHYNNCDANRVFVTFGKSAAATPSSGLLNAKFTYKYINVMLLMPYNFVADSFHTKKLSSRPSSSEVQFYTENGRFVVLSPPPYGQRTMFILGSLEMA